MRVEVVCANGTRACVEYGCRVSAGPLTKHFQRCHKDVHLEICRESGRGRFLALDLNGDIVGQRLTFQQQFPHHVRATLVVINDERPLLTMSTSSAKVYVKGLELAAYCTTSDMASKIATVIDDTGRRLVLRRSAQRSDPSHSEQKNGARALRSRLAAPAARRPQDWRCHKAAPRSRIAVCSPTTRPLELPHPKALVRRAHDHVRPARKDGIFLLRVPPGV